MKRILFSVLLSLCFFQLFSQVRINDDPIKGFEKRIRTYIDTMKVVDTHEHLISPQSVIQSGMFDFMLLLHHYAKDDIRSAGMSNRTFQTLVQDSLTILQKWNILEPYWNKTFNTTYCKAAIVTADKLFGVKTYDESTVEELSAKIKKAYKKDWYKTVLKEKCNIEFLINDGVDRSFGDTSMMRYRKGFSYFQIDHKSKLAMISKQQGLPVNTLEDLVKALKSEFVKAMDYKFVTIKTAIAYSRTLYFEDVSKEKADEVFKLVQNSKEEVLPIETIKPLSDYMMHRLLDLARLYGKPIQIHTGLQAGDGNYIENSNPTLLANLFLKYRDVQFVLFHGGYPFGGELATLAKNFRNVYIDLCWLYIISPSYSERYLHEWLETVPANKIMAFGADYENVENIYGHLLFAKEIITRVLCEKVRSGYFTESEALKVAQMILHDNAVDLFKLHH